MANTTINPFGPSSELPTRFPIVDNCNTDSGVYALSARQGKRLNGLCGIAQGMVINCLGDSITAGEMGNGQIASNKWTTQLADNLSCTVNNYGVGGTGICNSSKEAFVTRLNRMAENNIDCLVIFGGTNDYGGKYATTLGSIADSPAQGTNFYASFKYLIESAIAKYPSAAVCIITPIRRNDITAANQYGITLEQIVNAEIEVARHYAIPVYDYYHAGGLNPNVSAHRTAYTYDGLHPNQAGINKWLAPQITKFVANLLAFKSTNT